MLSLYYRIWVDAIDAEQAKKTQRQNWKLYSLIPMSLLMGANLLTFFYWMKALNHNLPLFFTVNIFNAKPINGFISLLLTEFVPFLILNYLLIFTNDRYLELQKKYPFEQGKLYKKYTLITLGLLIIPIILQKMFFQEV